MFAIINKVNKTYFNGLINGKPVFSSRKFLCDENKYETKELADAKIEGIEQGKSYYLEAIELEDNVEPNKIKKYGVLLNKVSFAKLTKFDNDPSVRFGIKTMEGENPLAIVIFDKAEMAIDFYAENKNEIAIDIEIITIKE